MGLGSGGGDGASRSKLMFECCLLASVLSLISTSIFSGILRREPEVQKIFPF